MVGHVKEYGSEEDRMIKFRASTPTIDRHGSIVRPEGIDTANFENNPIFLWGHDGYDSYAGPPKIESVIGKVVGHQKTNEYFDIDVEFAGPGVNPNGEKSLRMVRGGFLNTVSIGFYPKKAGWEVIDEVDIFVYRESELLEVSLVPIPANPEALVISNALDTILGLTPPPSGVDYGEQLRKHAKMLDDARQIRGFSSMIAKL
jgi:HK97 family phage prohead protease